LTWPLPLTLWISSPRVIVAVAVVAVLVWLPQLASARPKMPIIRIKPELRCMLLLIHDPNGMYVDRGFFTLCLSFLPRWVKRQTKTKSTMLPQAKAALCANPIIHSAAIVASRPISGGATSAGICEIYNVSLTLCPLNLCPTRGKIRTDRRAIGHANHLS
jgi:hypothetical protein